MFWVVASMISAVIAIYFLHAVKESNSFFLKLIIILMVAGFGISIYMTLGSLEMPDFSNL